MDSKKHFSTQDSNESSAKRDSDPGPAYTVDALGRKVWDKNYFTERAISKSTGGDVVEDAISSLYQGTFKKPVVPVPEVREDLKPRKETLDFSKYVGKTQIIEDSSLKHKQGGFFCKTCNCLLKDSQTYLDHLNGKKHNRMLGMTMRVEKVDAKIVAEKLKRMASQDSNAKTKEELENDARERIKELEMYEKELREKRKLMKKEKKKKKHQTEHINQEYNNVKNEYNGVKREKEEDNYTENKIKEENTDKDEEETKEKEYKEVKEENKQEKEEKERENNEEDEEELSPELEAMKASGLPISFV